jgi:hypothetical protein
MEMVINKKASSSGSLMAERNLTIDNAPTSPSDNASEDLTIDIISIVVNATRKKLAAKDLRSDRLWEHLVYVNSNKSDNTKITKVFIKNSFTEMCAFSVTKNR